MQESSTSSSNHSSKIRSPATRSKTSLAIENLLDDCRYLAKHAVETDQLPASVDVKRLYQIRLNFEEWGEIKELDDFAFVVEMYEALERRLGPVTASTLRATEEPSDREMVSNSETSDKRTSRRIFGKKKSVARQYVDYLFGRTILIIFLILLGHLAHFTYPVFDLAVSGDVIEQAVGSDGNAQTGRGDAEEPRLPSFPQMASAINADPKLLIGLVAIYLIPFAYGALGADAFLLRETTHKLHTRQFDPRRIPENRARFLLGALSGGIVVFFVSSDVLQTPTSVFNVGGAALGFIAGFSTDFLFDTLDRVVNAILPRSAGSSRDLEDRRADDEILRHYRHRLDQANDDKEKEILRSVVEDLESRARSGN